MNYWLFVALVNSKIKWVVKTFYLKSTRRIVSKASFLLLFDQIKHWIQLIKKISRRTLYSTLFTDYKGGLRGCKAGGWFYEQIQAVGVSGVSDDALDTDGALWFLRLQRGDRSDSDGCRFSSRFTGSWSNLSDAEMRWDAEVFVICCLELFTLACHRQVFFVFGPEGEREKLLERDFMAQLILLFGLSFGIFSLGFRRFIRISFFLTFCILALRFLNGTRNKISTRPDMVEICFVGLLK